MLRGAAIAPEAWRAALRAGLFGLVLVAPLPFGSVRPTAVLLLELCAAGLGMAAVLVLQHDPSGLPARARTLAGPALVILAVGLLQLVPVPTVWTRLVVPRTAAVRESVGQLLPETASTLAASSLDPTATRDALVRFVAYALILVVAAVAVQRPKHLRHAAWAIALAGALEGLYGSAEYLSGHQHVLGWAKRSLTDGASGTFVNPNHFAGFLAMTLPIAMALVLESARGLPAARHWRERLLCLGGSAGLGVVVGTLATALIWFGVILSYSRGGLAVALAAVALLGAWSGRASTRVRLLAALLVLPTLLLLWLEVQAPGERFVAQQEELLSLSGRLPVWVATLGMVPDYLLLGTGLGTFEAVFPLYQPAHVGGEWSHAHCDWLQSLVEGGPAVTLALVALLFLLLRRRGARRPLLGAAVCAGIAAVALHSLTDFSLRIPANAVLAACLAGLSCSPAAVDRARPAV